MSTNNAESEIRTTEHQTNARFLLAADGDGPWAFDLDGTLYEGQRIDGMYQDPDILAVSVKPIKHACALVQSLIEEGNEVHPVAQESTGEPLLWSLACQAQTDSGFHGVELRTLQLYPLRQT